MNIFFTCFLVALSLSMDAFSLALIYGTYGLSKKNELILAVIVGLFHFFMPLLGLGFGNFLLNYFVFNLDLMVGIIFLIIGIEMVISGIKEEEVKILISLVGFFLFGLSVSIDSFTTGIGMSVLSHNYIGVAMLFMIVSGICTYIGLRFGNSLSERLGKYATIGGGIVMVGLGLMYFL
ncbi:MAG: manganese efflux pump [Bacilli bacterium]|nr:manganese efflux pump [Bacilli bacterium]